jgi:hypothetical protein
MFDWNGSWVQLHFDPCIGLPMVSMLLDDDYFYFYFFSNPDIQGFKCRTKHKINLRFSNNRDDVPATFMLLNSRDE